MAWNQYRTSRTTQAVTADALSSTNWGVLIAIAACHTLDSASYAYLPCVGCGTSAACLCGALLVTSHNTWLSCILHCQGVGRVRVNTLAGPTAEQFRRRLHNYNFTPLTTTTACPLALASAT